MGNWHREQTPDVKEKEKASSIPKVIDGDKISTKFQVVAQASDLGNVITKLH
jgi:hypothetical protein